MTKTITSGAQLRAQLEQLFEQGLKTKLARRALKEKQLQNATSGALSGGKSDQKKRVDEDDDGSTASKTFDADKEALKTGEVTTDAVIAKLNTIRSGKSFKDDSVHSAIDQYVNSLKKAERVALLAFLKGIGQIVTGEIPATDAVEPADPEPSVAMKKRSGPGGGKESVTIKPNVVVGGGSKNSDKKQQKKSEDTTPPVPIKVK